MYTDPIAPWEQYPKYLRFSEVLNPLKVITDFFSSGWPDDHRQDLKEWRYHVLNDAYFKGRNGPGDLLFIHDETIQLIEALHLLLIKYKCRFPKLKEATVEQIEQEKLDWVYFPNKLSQKEIINPYHALKGCFKKFSPQEYREHLHEWLHAALYDHAADETLTAGEIIDVYQNVRKLYSAAWLIHQRETMETLTHESWGYGKTADKETSKAEVAQLSPLRDIDPDLTRGEERGLTKVKAVIIERILSVRYIYLIGNHPDPFTFYLLILIDDQEKIPEHEIANKIEDNCKHLTSVFAFVHKVNSAKEGLAKGRRFWNNTIDKSICIYTAQGTDVLKAQVIDAKVWKERAEQNWQRWGTQGKEFLKGATRYMDDGNYNLALFCLHQAAESSLIGIITAILEYRTNGHSLARKIKITLLFTDEIKYVLQLNAPEGVRLFSLLQSGYAEARYKSTFEVDKELARLLRQSVSLLLERIKQTYEQFISDQIAL